MEPSRAEPAVRGGGGSPASRSTRLEDPGPPGERRGQAGEGAREAGAEPFRTGTRYAVPARPRRSWAQSRRTRRGTGPSYCGHRSRDGGGLLPGRPCPRVVLVSAPDDTSRAAARSRAARGRRPARGAEYSTVPSGRPSACWAARSPRPRAAGAEHDPDPPAHAVDAGQQSVVGFSASWGSASRRAAPSSIPALAADQRDHRHQQRGYFVEQEGHDHRRAVGDRRSARTTRRVPKRSSEPSRRARRPPARTPLRRRSRPPPWGG